MRKSLFASWTDRLSQTQATTESSWNSTVTHVLVLMVSELYHRVTNGKPLWHGFPAEEALSLLAMANLFIGREGDEECRKKVARLTTYLGNRNPDIYAHLQHEFRLLKIANLAVPGDSEEQVASLRLQMVQGFQSIKPGNDCTLGS